jgi:hypothetical protein
MASLDILKQSLEHSLTTAVKHHVYPDNVSDSAIAQWTHNPRPVARSTTVSMGAKAAKMVNNTPRTRRPL